MTQTATLLRAIRPNIGLGARIADLAPRDGAALRMAAASTLALALLFLGASLVVCPLPLSGHLASVGLTVSAAPLLQILPTMAAMLGVLAGVLGMAAPTEAPPEAANGPPSGRPEPPPYAPTDGAGLQEAVAELRALLVQERQELGNLRELSTSGTKEAMLLAERLAGTALDAELRLTASVVQAERALRHPSSAATRAAETSVRVERMLSRTESVLRNLPKATVQAVSTLQPETAPVLSAVQPFPAGWTHELSALRSVGHEISRSAQEAVATLSHAAQTTIGRLTEAVVTAVEFRPAAGAEPAPCEPALAERIIADLAAVTRTLQHAANGLDDRAASLCAAGQHVETVAERLLASPLPHESAGLDPAVVARLEMAVAELQREIRGLGTTVARVSALEPMIDQHLSAAAAVTEAAGRAEQSADSVATASQVIVETTDEVVLQIARLAGISGHAETQAAVLPAIAAQMAEATGRLQAAALQTPQEPALRALPETLARLEATLAQQGGTTEALLTGLTEWQAGVKGVLLAVSERLALQRKLEEEGGPSPLHQIDVVARETGLLLRQTEALAEAVVAGEAPCLPPLLAECTPALLAGVEATIARLRSVATALALASDGPAAKQKLSFYASGNSARP